METLLIAVAYLQTIAISLGVGASTVAIGNYIIAIRDNTIDVSERRIMGVGYTLLRVAMGVILVTLVVQALALLPEYGTSYLQPFILFVWTIVCILYLNAVLMTRHLMPRTIGPALQAVSWYTLGTLYFLSTLYLTNFSYGQFMLWFGVALILALVLLNGVIAFVKRNASKAE